MGDLNALKTLCVCVHDSVFQKSNKRMGICQEKFKIYVCMCMNTKMREKNDKWREEPPRWA